MKVLVWLLLITRSTLQIIQGMKFENDIPTGTLYVSGQNNVHLQMLVLWK